MAESKTVVMIYTGKTSEKCETKSGNILECDGKTRASCPPEVEFNAQSVSYPHWTPEKLSALGKFASASINQKNQFTCAYNVDLIQGGGFRHPGVANESCYSVQKKGTPYCFECSSGKILNTTRVPPKGDSKEHKERRIQ